MVTFEWSMDMEDLNILLYIVGFRRNSKILVFKKKKKKDHRNK